MSDTPPPNATAGRAIADHLVEQIVTGLAAAKPVPREAIPWWVLPGLAAMVLLIFAGALGVSCVLGDSTLRTAMFQTAAQAVAMALGFYFGSSAGSQKKDETLARAALPPPPGA